MTFLKKILLLDEQAQFGSSIREALESTGRYLVREEHDTRRAAGAVLWFQPDLILCDSPAPRSDAELLRELEQRNSSTPVVFVQNAGGNAVASGGVLGGYSFFATPLPTDLLLEYIQELLS
jgi:chemotaxis response regulator CheB